VVVAIEQQRGQVEGAVAGQDRRVDVDHACDRGAVCQQVGGGEVIVNEIGPGRDSRAAALTDPAQHRQHVAGSGTRLQGGMQAVPVAAAGQGRGDQVWPAARSGTQALLGIVQLEQPGQQAGSGRSRRSAGAGVQDVARQSLLNPKH
jgi:hypothetical protein